MDKDQSNVSQSRSSEKDFFDQNVTIRTLLSHFSENQPEGRKSVPTPREEFNVKKGGEQINPVPHGNDMDIDFHQIETRLEVILV